MTKQERLKMHKLEIENRELREKIDKHIETYRDQLYEIVELRARAELHAMIENGSIDQCQ